MEHYSRIWREKSGLSDGEIVDDDDDETVGVVEVVQRYACRCKVFYCLI